MPLFLSFEEVKTFFICANNKMKQSELLFQFLTNLRDDNDVIKSSVHVVTESLLELTGPEILELNMVCNLFCLHNTNYDNLLNQLMNCIIVIKYTNEKYYETDYLDYFRFHLKRFEVARDLEDVCDASSVASDTSDIFKDLEKLVLIFLS